MIFRILLIVCILILLILGNCSTHVDILQLEAADGIKTEAQVNWQSPIARFSIIGSAHSGFSEAEGKKLADLTAECRSVCSFSCEVLM